MLQSDFWDESSNNITDDLSIAFMTKRLTDVSARPSLPPILTCHPL
jgi:hypothetical protein